jgi:peptide/nickel transport system substrate-binding protein
MDQLRTLFRDIRFRRAVAHAINREVVRDQLYGGLAVPQWSPVSHPSPFYAGRECYGCPTTERDAVLYEYDLGRAAALLDEIGLFDTDGDGIREFADGQPVEFLLETNAGGWLREAFCRIVSEGLEAIGIRATARALPFDTMITRLLGGPVYEAAALGLTGGNEPNGGADVYRSSGDLHFWHYSGAEEPFAHERRIDELFDLALGTFDFDQAFDYYREYQILYATEDLGMIFSVNQQFTYAISTRLGNRELAGVTATPSGSNGLGWDLFWVMEPQ